MNVVNCLNHTNGSIERINCNNLQTAEAFKAKTKADQEKAIVSAVSNATKPLNEQLSLLNRTYDALNKTHASLKTKYSSLETNYTSLNDEHLDLKHELNQSQSACFHILETLNATEAAKTCKDSSEAILNLFNQALDTFKNSVYLNASCSVHNMYGAVAPQCEKLIPLT